MAALKQSYAFQLSQSPINIEELNKKSTTRIFKERSPGHTKPFIIATSSSAADFMLSTPKRSTVSTIAKSPPLRNPRKSKAEATVKKLKVEKAIANISLTPTTDDSLHETKTKGTTIIDLVDTSDEPQPHTPLSINLNCSSFGQDIVILSSDSQESSNSFHTASIHSVPTRTVQPKDPEPMDWTPPNQEPERDADTRTPEKDNTSEDPQN